MKVSFALLLTFVLCSLSCDATSPSGDPTSVRDETAIDMSALDLEAGPSTSKESERKTIDRIIAYNSEYDAVQSVLK